MSGHQPPPVEEARILELGCATGGNLTPIALSLPRSECVGVESVYLSYHRISCWEVTVQEVELVISSLWTRAVLLDVYSATSEILCDCTIFY